MKGLINLSEASLLALHSMALLAQNKNQALTTKKIAEIISSSEAHLSKVMQRLSKMNLVESHRGPNGGFYLGQPEGSVTLLEIYEAIEGPLKEEGCLWNADRCPFKHCLFGGLIKKTRHDFREYLSSKTLKDLIEPSHNNNEIKED